MILNWLLFSAIIAYLANCIIRLSNGLSLAKFIRDLVIGAVVFAGILTLLGV